MTNILDGRLNEIREAGTWKDERVITTEQASEIGVAGRKEKLLNFCANNYLGLSVCVNWTISLSVTILVEIETSLTSCILWDFI